MAGTHALEPAQAAVLQALCDFRDQQARYANLPVFRILSDEALVALAEARPQTLEELANVPGLTAAALSTATGWGCWRRSNMARAAARFTRRAIRPAPARLTCAGWNNCASGAKRSDAAWGWSSDVVMPRDLLEALSAANPKTPDEVAAGDGRFPLAVGTFRPADFTGSRLERKAAHENPLLTARLAPSPARSIFIEINGSRILLECGMFQGRRADTYQVNRNFPFDPKSLDAVILSHAHIDHSGNLPNLVKQGYTRADLRHAGDG